MKCDHVKILITGSCLCSQVSLRVHNVYYILWTLAFIDDIFVSIAMVTQVCKLYTFHNNISYRICLVRDISCRGLPIARDWPLIANDAWSFNLHRAQLKLFWQN